MSADAYRELRKETAGVQAGEETTVTVSGRAVARLVRLPSVRCYWLPKAELVARLRRAQADPGLRDDLARLAGETTDDLDPIR